MNTTTTKYKRKQVIIMVINKSNISYEELKKELETGKTVIKFYADWCGPCNIRFFLHMVL